jgi:hypothetical protein
VKVLPAKRSRTRTAGTTARQRHAKIHATATTCASHTNQNGYSSTNRDGHVPILPIEEKLIRPSVSMPTGNNRTALSTARHPAPETLSYELNFCLQDKQELIPSSHCLLGCTIFIDEHEYLSTVSKDDLNKWSTTIGEHGGIVTDDIHHPQLTHFVCAYRTSARFRQVCRHAHVRLVTAHWLNDVLQRKKLFVPNLAIHYPSPYEPCHPDRLPLATYFFTMTGFQGEGVLVSKFDVFTFVFD